MNPRLPLMIAWTALVLVSYLGSVRFDPGMVLAGWSSRGLAVGPGLVDALTGHAVHLLGALATVVASWGLGLGAIRVARARGWPAALCAGLLVSGTAGLGLGLTGLIRSGLPGGIAMCMAVITAIRDRRMIADLPRASTKLARRLTASGWCAGWLVVATTLAVLPAALAPEITYDALAVHLGVPLEYLKAGKIVRLEHLMYADLPSLLQMEYLFAIAVGGDGAARLVHFILGIAGMLLAGRLARRIGGDAAAGWAVAIMAATPFVATLMLRANVDLGVMLCTAAAADRLAGRRGSGPDLFMAGLLAGAAAAVKPTGGYALIAVAATVLMTSRPHSIRSILILAAGAAVALIAWPARSWFLTGNPAYPFLHGAFDGVGWSPENAAILRRDVQGENYGNVVYAGGWAKLAAPWLVIMKDRIADAALGPFTLILMPALLMRMVRGPAVRMSAAFAVVFSACWFLTSRDPRFLLPVWPVLAALSGAVLTAIPGFAGGCLRVVLLTFMVLTPPFIAERSAALFNPGPVLWGSITRQRYAEVLLPPGHRYVPLALEAAGRGRFNGGRVLVAGGVKAAWIAPRALYQSMSDTPHLVAWTRESATPDRLAVKVRQAGVARMLYDAGAVAYLRKQFDAYSLTPRERAVLGSFWTTRLMPLRWFTEPPVMVLYGVLRTPVPSSNPPLPGWPE